MQHVIYVQYSCENIHLRITRLISEGRGVVVHILRFIANAYFWVG